MHVIGLLPPILSSHWLIQNLEHPSQVLCLFMVSMIGYTLLHFSHMFDETNQEWKNVFWIFLLLTSISLSTLHIAKLHHIFLANCIVKLQREKSLLSDWKARQEKFYPMLDTLTPVLGFMTLFIQSSTMAVFLILYSRN